MPCVASLSPASPPGLERYGQAPWRVSTLLAGIRAGGGNLHRLPKRVFKAFSDCDESSVKATRPLTVAGAAQVKDRRVRHPLLLPVELRHANHTASTNTAHFTQGMLAPPLQ
jgi:hypothetical protein